MEVNLKDIGKHYILKKVMLFYQSNDCSHNEAIATVHKLDDKQQLLPGKRVNSAQVEEIFRSCDGDGKLKYISGNIIAYSSTSVVWFEPGIKRPIYFNPGESNRQKLHKISGMEVVWPNIVFKLSGNTVYCWAVKTKSRPNLQTKLYDAPFTNINNGAVCMPPLALDRNRMPLEQIAEISRIFFGGSFTHHAHGADIRIKGGHDAFWLHYVKQNAKKFPNQYLKESKKTLQDIL